MAKTKTHEPDRAVDFHVLIPLTLRAKLDNLRRKEEDFPSRGEMLRRLVERAKL